MPRPLPPRTGLDSGVVVPAARADLVFDATAFEPTPKFPGRPMAHYLMALTESDLHLSRLRSC